MEPTVLAGAIEFSPAEIALIIAVVIAAGIAVTAPGWLVLAVVMGRRPGPGASSKQRWAARCGGALAGLAISAAVAALLGTVQDVDAVVCVPVAWITCWVLAALLRRRPAPAPVPAQTGQGWGR